MQIRWRRWISGLALAWLAGAAQASGFSSSFSSPGTPLHFKPEQVVSFAKKVERQLAGQGAHVALLARMGRPVSELPEGMYFTHVAFAVYSETTTADQRQLPGYAIYNLYQKDGRPDVSELVQDSPVDFFSGVAELEAGIIVPSAELQQRLLEVIASPAYSALHDPRYSLIANPYTLGRQNCTEFVLDVIQAAIYQTSELGQIKAQSKQFFQGQTVHVSGFKLLLGSLFSREISLSNHPTLPPVTATFETLARYLQQYDQAEFFTLKQD